MLKELSKRLQSPDSFVSLILGLAVVLVIGTLIFNYISSRRQQVQQQQAQQEAAQKELPLTHTVIAGETLWSIAQKYYNSGYNWVDIQKANNLSSANVIEVGQTLTIPAAPPIATGTAMLATTPTPAATSEVTPASGQISSGTSVTQPAGKTYTVVRGDNLWNISIAQYGNGYKWVDIARENHLVNPNLIHAGNVFTLP